MIELGPALIISGGILLAGACLLGAFIGLWLGERGRRLDVQWYAGLDAHPTGDEARAEIDTTTGEAAAEAAARQRAELHQIKAGLARAARAEGLTPTDEELEEEALRILGSF